MSLLMLERIGPGEYRVTNQPMTLDVKGPTLEEALVSAMVKAGVGTEGQIHKLTGSFNWAEAFQTLMEAA